MERRALTKAETITVVMNDCEAIDVSDANARRMPVAAKVPRGARPDGFEYEYVGLLIAQPTFGDFTLTHRKSGLVLARFERAADALHAADSLWRKFDWGRSAVDLCQDPDFRKAIRAAASANDGQTFA